MIYKMFSAFNVLETFNLKTQALRPVYPCCGAFHGGNSG